MPIAPTINISFYSRVWVLPLCMALIQPPDCRLTQTNQFNSRSISEKPFKMSSQFLHLWPKEHHFKFQKGRSTLIWRVIWLHQHVRAAFSFQLNWIAVNLKRKHKITLEWQVFLYFQFSRSFHFYPSKFHSCVHSLHTQIQCSSPQPQSQ